MKNAIKFLLTLPLIFTLIAPPRLLGDRDTLSPRSLFQTKNQQRIQEIQSNLENGLLTIKQVNRAYFISLHSREKQKERKKSLASGDQLVAMVQRQEYLPTATELALKQPQNQEAFAAYLRLAQRLSSRQHAINEFISAYLKYYSNVRNSRYHPDLVDLHHAISPEELQQYITDNIQSNDLEYLQLEFLSAEIVRRRKRDKLNPSQTPKDFYFDFFYNNWSQVWKTLPVFESAKELLTFEAGGSLFNNRLKDFIYFHKYGKQNDRNFRNFQHADLRFIDCKKTTLNADFTNSLLSHSSFQNCRFEHSNFSGADLRHVNLIDTQFIEPIFGKSQGYLCSPLTFVTEEQYKDFFSKFDDTKPKIFNETGGLLNQNGPSSLVFRLIDPEKLKNKLISTFFRVEGVEDMGTFFSIPGEGHLSAILPLPLLAGLIGFNSHLLAVAATLGFFYAVIKLASFIHAKEKLQNELLRPHWFTDGENVFGGLTSSNPLPFDVSL